MKRFYFLGIVVSALLLVGCDSGRVEIEERPPSAQPDNGVETQDQQAEAEPLSAESPDVDALTITFKKIKVKAEDGSTAFSIKPKDDGAKLVDADEKELARYNATAKKVKVKADNDEVLAYVVGAAPSFKVEGAKQERRLWKLQKQIDGDWKLEDGEESLIYKIKRRDYGFEIEDPHEKSLYKIKVKGEKTSLRNASDTTVKYTNDPVHPLAFVCLGLDVIEDERVRAGLAVAVQIHEGK